MQYDFPVNDSRDELDIPELADTFDDPFDSPLDVDGARR